VQHFLHEHLPDVDHPHSTFIAGDDAEAVATTITSLVESIPGFKALKAGPLENSKIVELLGPNWLGELSKLNFGYKRLGEWKFEV
jgi:predicted dinucleotide-binding enzyme